MTIRESSGSAKILLADNARVVLERRYLAKDSEGRPVETPEEMFRRVAHNNAQAELLYNPLEDAPTALLRTDGAAGVPPQLPHPDERRPRPPAALRLLRPARAR